MRKIKQFFLTTLAVLCSTLTTWAAYNGTPDAPTQINGNYADYGLSADFDGYYVISTAAELYGFAELVNGGTTDANGVLTANIVVNENVLNANGTLNGTPTYSWTPIGTYGNKFNGTFDGNGHTISGLYFDNTTNKNYPDGGKYAGLIGYANGATIKNAGVIDSYIKGYQYVGGICGHGYNYNTNITNCYNTGTVSGSSTSVGGICGQYGTQTNCHNTGTVSGSGNYVGGICGYYGNQNNCHNTGTVSSSSDRVGGISGGSGTQTNCYNTGTVSSSSNGVGGICGDGGTQTNCYNTGLVKGSQYVGGICGEYGIQNKCYNTGTVSGSSYVGGICGYESYPTNCYYLAGCGSKNTLGVSATAEEFASGKITFLLNGSTSEGDLAWYQTLGDDGDAYPVFDNTHAVVYTTQPCTSGFSNVENNVKEHPSTDAIGYCTACGRFTSQGTLVTESNYSGLNLTADFVDYYAISNTAELYWFADEVNNGNTAINAVLTADIVVNENVLKADGTLNGTPTYSWTPIGTSSKRYEGTFDGNGHTISGLYFNNTTNKNYPDGGNYVGLIGYANEATIKNVGVIDSYLKGYQSVGGICGASGTQNNCYNTGTVSGSYYNIGGICGYGGTQNNCNNKGTVSGSNNYVGGICGYGGTQTYCYNIGTVSGSSGVGGICGYGGTQTNCYYLVSCHSKNTLGVSVTAEEFASGKITYLLNGSTSEGNLVWYQTLGDGGDAFPVFDNTHAVVYATKPCPSYSNVNNNVHKDHLPMNAIGYCTACNQYIAQGATLVTASNYSDLNLSAAFVGYYAISNSPDLYWFANFVNNGETTANAVLTADIVVNENVLNADGTLNGTPTYSWTPIGTNESQYKGTFDGNKHTISGLYFNNTTNSAYHNGGNYVGLIGYAYTATIKNVRVIDSYIRGYSYVGGICGTGGTQTNCYNTGTVSGYSYVGGICGYYGTQTNCYNTGMVSGSGNYVGGICGTGGIQTNCNNTGTVSGSSYYVGGICGQYGTQTNCHNTGTISGKIVGGICGSHGTQTNCYNTGMVSGSGNYVGGIYGTLGKQTNCYYLAGCCSESGDGVSATAEEFASGKISYLLNGSNFNGTTWRQTLFADASPVLDASHNAVTGYFDEVENVVTVYGNVVLTTNYTIAEGKILNIPVGATLRTTGDAVITNNGTIVCNGSISGNNLAGSGSFIYNALSANDVALVKTSFIYKGSAFTLDDDVEATISNRTFCGKAFTFDASSTSVSYANNRNVGNNATVTWTNTNGSSVSKTFSITPKDVELVWKNTTLTYNGSAQKPTATATGMVNNESLAVTVSGEQTNANTYTATASITDNNYKLPDNATKEFTINPKGVTLEWGVSTFTYNGREQAPTATATGLIDGDACTVTVTGAQTNAGANHIATASTLSNTNYALPTANTKAFTINAKEIELTWGESTFTYNGTEQAPTATATGLIEGDACTVAVTGAQTNAGTAYTATASALSNTNYALPTAKTKAFIINPKAVELVWENTTLTYNGSAQKPTATATGMVTGENLAVAVSGEQTNVGTYTATASITDNNYKLPDEVTKEFTIGKATPTYTAPENLAILCNQTLADVVLPDGFAFENLNAELTEGENTLTVEFTPEDTANYKVVEGIEVKVANAVHTAAPDAAVPATCTESGLTEGSHCSICNEVLVAQEVIPAGHKADSVQFENVVAATCTVAGSKDSVVYCSVCKAELSRTKIEILVTGHKADSVQFENIVAATCTVAGSKDSVVYCTVCKAELSRTKIEIPATGHKADSIQFENVVAATCTVAGSKDSVVYCSVCGVEVSRTKIEIPATGHTVVVDSAVAATATETGLTEGSHCSVCGETIVAQEVIPATGEQGGEGNGSEGGNENQGGNENTEPATAVAESAAQQVSIYSHHNIIVVENADAEIFVYNIMGNLVATTNDANAEIVINTTGVYIVKVGGTSKRVMINN